MNLTLHPGMTFTIAGRLTTMTKSTARQRLEQAGATVLNALANKTEVFVTGERPGEKLTQARLRGLPVLSEEQLVELLQGRTVTIEQPKKRPKVASVASQRAGFEKLDKLLKVETVRDTWSNICSELDKLPDDALEVATDTVLMALGRHTGDFDGSYNYMSTPKERYTPSYQPPLGWLKDILAGKDTPKLRIIKILNLYDRKLTGKVINPVLECKNLCNVELLDLSWNKLPMGFYSKLGQASQFSSLRTLRLENSALTAKATDGLTRDSVLTSLRRLDLGRCDMKKGGVVAGLFRDGALPALEWLNLDNCGIGPADLDEISMAGQLTRLRHLYLGWNGFDETSIRNFFGASHLDLETLAMDKCGLGPWFSQILGNAAQLRSLRELNLQFNSDLDDTVVDALLSLEPVSLEHLQLDDTAISPAALTRLVDTPHMASLVGLHASGEGLQSSIGAMSRKLGSEA